jgi:hypothetical protein
MSDDPIVQIVKSLVEQNKHAEAKLVLQEAIRMTDKKRVAAEEELAFINTQIESLESGKMTREEALAEVWASMTGRLDEFLADKAGSLDRTNGSYRGFIEDARELIRRLESRGDTIVAATNSTQ